MQRYLWRRYMEVKGGALEIPERRSSDEAIAEMAAQASHGPRWTPAAVGRELPRRCGLVPVGLSRDGAVVLRLWGRCRGGNASSCRWVRDRKSVV